jgi:hypothetical protein
MMVLGTKRLVQRASKRRIPTFVQHRKIAQKLPITDNAAYRSGSRLSVDFSATLYFQSLRYPEVSGSLNDDVSRRSGSASIPFRAQS